MGGAGGGEPGGTVGTEKFCRGAHHDGERGPHLIRIRPDEIVGIDDASPHAAACRVGRRARVARPNADDTPALLQRPRAGARAGTRRRGV